jgi:DNA polymerase-3 subunit beta
MKFSCTQENLKTGLMNVVHIAGKNANLPILSNVLIDVSDSLIKFVTTDLEIGITASVRGKVEKTGRAAVNAKLLTDYINLLPNTRVDVELTDTELKINCGNFNTNIKSEDASDYPIIPAIDKSNCFIFNFEEFKQTVGGVIFAAATDETRIELSGACFEFKDNELILAATDSYRLIERKIKYKNKQTGELERKKIIIPCKTLAEVVRISTRSDAIEITEEKTEKEIKLYVSENQVMFAYDDVELVSRVIEGQYPDYQQIIPVVPAENKITAKIGRRELIQAVKASALFSQTNINDVEISCQSSTNKAIVNSVSGQTGKSVVEVPMEAQGDDKSVVLNYKYLIDGLNSFAGERVILEIADGNTPVILRIEDQADCLYIIMPIKK